uniref:Ionotropic receptor 75a n=1 Tax=Drosophila melanogaster TaxID=7227 RepID=IR75A_DROME|nr:ionotropic receptor 75a [Drosophila melanogaster]Q9VVL1.2 RecName: Full=Ionotropic receptor 75a [Drosophila melanogaster]AAF49300.2 ionotropic receptor 75a [Drosophila melanogaster]APD16193.1 ionotropic receptor 75a [Drosophila melanogaster]|eukprot:NP_649012.2 ionotropic receptor 75a [Drosophila melanogaster]
MQLVQLANFVLDNLVQSRIGFIVLFHCWQSDESLKFAQQFMKPIHPILVYHQFVQMRGVLNWSHLELSYMGHTQPTLAIYVDIKCDQTQDLLEEASREQIYNQHYHWLLVGNQSKLEFYDLFGLFNISIDADVSYVKEQIQDNNDSVAYAVHDVYNNGKIIGGQLNVTGSHEMSCDPFVCRRTRHLSSLQKRSKYGNREQLTDVVLRVATVVTQRPLTLSDDELIRFLSQENDTHIDSLARFGFHLTLILRDLLHCKMKFIFSDSWSKSDVVGGSVGAVVDQTADLTATPSLATEGRLKYLSAIIETGFFRSVCIFRTPHNAGLRGDVFLQPFSPLVWYLFGGVLSLIGVLLWITFYMECKRMQKRWRLDYLPSLLSTFLISFGAACIQSSSLIPRSAGGRLIYFALFLISFIMYNYYTSVVVSSLLSSPVKSKIKTMRQLAESSLTVGLEPLPFTKSYLNYSRLPEIHLFIKRKIESQTQNPELWLPAEQGVLRVRDNPGYVYVFETSSGYAYVERYFTAQEICDLNEVLFRPEQLFYTHLHRNSTYKELFRLRFLRILETGVYRKQRSYWVHMKLHCVAQNFVITVGMEYVAPLLLMLICADILVVVILLVELAWKRFFTRHLTFHP